MTMMMIIIATYKHCIREVSHYQAQPVRLKQGASNDIKQARAESCDEHGRKSIKWIGNQPSRVES